MKKLLFVFLFSLLALSPGFSQVFSTSTGKVHFFSEAPLENIEANTKKCQCAFNPSTGQVSVRVPMATFAFDKALMQEHFNENYLETAKYPHASIEGKLDKELDLSKNGVQQANVVAMVNIHGVKKEYTLPVNITVENGAPTKALTRFKVKLADHNIEIPTIVMKNLAEVVDVDAEFELKPMQKK